MKKSLLFIILALAFAVRIIGINYGLPFAYHDDESIIVNYALAYGTGDFNPHVFKMSPLLSYILFFIYGFFFLIGFIFSYFKSINDFAYLYLSDPTVFYIIGRFTFGVLCGTVSVALIYTVAKRYFNKTTALFAALFLAFSYLHVRDSHYIYFDIPLTFSILVFFLKADDFLKAGTRRLDYIYLGMLFGIACSVKYSGALLVLPFSAAILYNLYIRKAKTAIEKTKDILACLASFIICLFALNPFSFIDFQTFKRDILNLPFIHIPAHFHLKVSLLNGCGLPIVITGILGMLLSLLLIRRNRQTLLVAYALFYYWVINRSSQGAERLALPLVPVILMFAASVLVGIKNSVRNKISSYAAVSMLTILLIWPSAVRIYYSDILFLREDTRTLAYKWIKENIKRDARIALDATASWFPRLEKSKEQLKERLLYSHTAQFDKPRGADRAKTEFILSNPDYPQKSYCIFYLSENPQEGFLSAQPAIPLDYSYLKSKGIRYVLLSNVLIHDKYREFVKDIEAHAKPIKTFSPYKEDVDTIRPKELSTVPAAAFMLNELIDRKSYGPFMKLYKLD